MPVIILIHSMWTYVQNFLFNVNSFVSLEDFLRDAFLKDLMKYFINLHCCGIVNQHQSSLHMQFFGDLSFYKLNYPTSLWSMKFEGLREHG